MAEVIRNNLGTQQRKAGVGIRRHAVAAAVAIAAASASSAWATSYSWDPGATPATPSGGNGAWNISNPYWANAGNDFIWTNAASDTATFAGTAGNISITAPIQANALTFTTAGYVISGGSGGSFVLSGTTPTITTTADATFNAAIGGTAGLTKAGAGTLTLGGVNTYTGNTTLNAGKITLGTGAAFASSSNIVLNGASTLDLGGNSQSVANLSLGTNNSTYTGAITNGSLTVSNATGVTLAGSNATASSLTKLDLSGLSNFTVNLTAAGKTLLVSNLSGGGVNPVAVTQVVLGNNNTLTASNLQIGNGQGGTTSSAPFHSGVLDLGQTNAINADSLTLGAYRAVGTLDFRSGLTGATVTLRGYAGNTAMNQLLAAQNQNGANTTSTIDLTGGSVDGIVTTGIVSQTNSGGATANGFLSMGAGTMTFNTLVIANSISTNAVTAANALGTLNQNGGTIVANAVNLSLRNPASGGIADNVSGTYNLGSSNSATLSAATIGFGAGSVASNAREVINFNNGVITNYDPSLSQSGAAALVGAPTSAQNLVIAGNTGGGAGNNNSTLTINLASTGSHALRATSGQSITVASTALIAGNGALTADGPGTVILRSTNTYVGGTRISSGTVVTGNNAALGAGAVNVSGTGNLTIGDGAANTLGGISGLAMADGTTLKFANAASAITLASGAFTLGNINLDLSNLYNTDGTYTLINGQAGANAIGMPTFLNADTANHAYSFAVSGNNGVLTVSEVPEPALLGVAGLGVAALIRRRRRADA
ncbi:MAG: beta strand repeat-containing protein [Tepidisphaeraceae bacterium]